MTGEVQVVDIMTVIIASFPVQNCHDLVGIMTRLKLLFMQ